MLLCTVKQLLSFTPVVVSHQASLSILARMLWRNLMSKRQILVTVIEICLPLLFAAILIALRHRVHSISHPNATSYTSQSVNELPWFFHHRKLNPWELAYVPSNSTAVKSIAEAVEKNIRVGRDLSRSSSPTPLLKAGPIPNFCPRSLNGPLKD
uniref:Uncharacterized protein n=1 Tax=Chelydra serpentina TaxID=8475 RepID=A0A8C3XQA7_CHESE